MSRREIDRKFDEIVAFAEVEKFLDTPVKRYSSGMYVRLAFAVAAHLEPEILIVDEVLAVGDSQFQQKCLDKMRECASSGRTVLLVSHQMNSVRDLCDEAVWLDKGQMRLGGPVDSVIEQYLTEAGARAEPGNWSDLADAPRTGLGLLRFTAAKCFGKTLDAFPEPDGPFHLAVRFDCKGGLSADIRIEFQILDRYHTRLVVANTFDNHQPLRLRVGESEIVFRIEQLHLAPGIYNVNLLAGDASDLQDSVSDALRLEVLPKAADGERVWNEKSLVTRAVTFQMQRALTRDPS
jgi:lipopolysaccharide transport system ATP-binding protein